MSNVVESLAIQYPRDENGIEIRPGYRPPFIKGQFDPRRFVPPKGIQPKHLANIGPTPNLLAATRRAFRKHALATAAAIHDPDLAMRHAKVCRMFLTMEQTLLGNGSHSKSTPLSPPNFPMPASGNKAESKSTSQPASETQPPDDYPF